MEFLRTFIHYFLHLGFPGIISYFFYRDKWKKVWLIMVATMVVDLDHLLASPIFDPHRLSIGFHPLHSYYAIGLYVLLLFFKRTRVVAIALVLHMITDFLDYLWVI